MLVLCSSVFAETKPDNGITPTSTSNSGSVYTKDGNIRIGSMKDKDKTAKELEEEAKKAKTEQPKINAIQNMFDMKGKIAHDRGGGAGTNCAWTVAWSYKGTPYGQVSDFATAVEAQEHNWAGSINTVGQLMNIAAQSGQLIVDCNPSDLSWNNAGELVNYNPPSRGDYSSAVDKYQPRPGDIAITRGNSYYYGHVVLVRPTDAGELGTIESGSHGENTYRPGAGGIHTNGDTPVAKRTVVGWIKSSDYANAVYPVGGGTPGSAYSKFVFGNIYDMGKSMCVIMEKFAEICEEVIERLLPAMIPLFWIMAIIDLVMTIVLAGFEINPFTVIVRFIKYGFFYFLIANWPELVDDFFLSFAFDTASGANVLTETTVTMNITNPQLVLQKGLMIIKPGIDYVSALSTAQAAVHIFACMVVTAFSLITMLSLMALAIYVMLSYIEFYIVASLAVVCLPYTPSGFTKWIPQASIAAVWKQTIRLFTLSMFIGLIGQIFANTTPADIIKKLAELGMKMNESGLDTVISAITLNSQMVDALFFYGGLCLNIIMLCIVTFFISQKVADKLSPGSVIQW